MFQTIDAPPSLKFFRQFPDTYGFLGLPALGNRFQFRFWILGEILVCNWKQTMRKSCNFVLKEVSGGIRTRKCVPVFATVHSASRDFVSLFYSEVCMGFPLCGSGLRPNICVQSKGEYDCITGFYKTLNMRACSLPLENVQVASSGLHPVIDMKTQRNDCLCQYLLAAMTALKFNWTWSCL